MTPEPDDRLGARDVLSQPRECALERLKTPEIVGQGNNPVLETARRLWWRAFDRLCGCIEGMRLSIFDRIFGPEPPTFADLEPEADHERLVRASPVAGEAFDPRNAMPGKIETAK